MSLSEKQAQILQVEELSFRVREKQILTQVGLYAGQGEFVGIIGPNGSGKSTLLKNVYKALRPQAGAVLLAGEDLLAMRNHDMAQRLSVVVQEHESSFDFTVEEVVLMGRRARRGLLESDRPEDRALVEEVLGRTGLAPIREQSFTTLSGGEKQRVLIARTLAQDTGCLILDEPTNHLDIKF
ncbi:MAG: ABC transporter ATP-binding protein, partial [Oscillospiraceae bacterium]